ncbi:hypothetical protein EN792_050245, partial [Mesorhizobium sp. M00.F.Ca.ET.149.01.1.1]
MADRVKTHGKGGGQKDEYGQHPTIAKLGDATGQNHHQRDQHGKGDRAPQQLFGSWQADAKPAPPCQWLEEAMVEAFSLHGLGRLAKDW